MFDNIALKANLGAKVAPAARAVVGRFGPSRRPSIVSISPTLDRGPVMQLVVHDCNPSLSAANHDNNSGDLINFYSLENDASLAQRPSYYITVRDIIRAIAIITSQVDLNFATTTTAANDFDPIAGVTPTQPRDQIACSAKDQLIICCSGSLLLYDPFSKTKTLSFNTSNPIDICLTICKSQHVEPSICPLAICAGQQRLCTFKFDPKPESGMSCELQSERSTSDTINCMTRGHLNGLELLLTGSREAKICLYELDMSVDFNLRASRLTIDESSPITCLCAIETVSRRGDESNETATDQQQQQQDAGTEQMNYFAFGLEGNFVGAYGLSSMDGKFISERLWRHKSKHSPLAMLMYDINGDGFDELVIGYQNGRLEARAPLTGQLLAATRCFKVGSNLASLMLADYFNDGQTTLIASATSGSLVGYRPRHRKPRQALQGYHSRPAASQPVVFGGADIDQWSLQGETAWLLGQQQGRANLQSIAEEAGQESLSGLAHSASSSSPILEENPNIETTTDQTRPLKCECQQNVALLNRVNSLQCEQIELEKKGCLIYHSRINQATHFRASDVRLTYRLDHDEHRMCLSLIVIVESEVDQVKLIRLEDESKNYVSSGLMLIDTSANIRPSTDTGSSPQTVVVPLRSNKNERCELSLTAYCVPRKTATVATKTGQQEGKVCQSHKCKIDLPKYSMFALETAGQANDSDQQISISCLMGDNGSRRLPKILHWLRANILCLQIGNKPLVETSDGSGPLQPSDPIVDESGSFDYRFCDIRRQTCNKLDTSPVQNNKQPARRALFRIAYSCNKVEKILIEGTDSDLVVDVVKSLLVDQLGLEPELDSNANNDQVRSEAWLARRQGLRPIIEQLNELSERASQLEESETRVQSELFESTNYSKDLLKQFSIACELNEFLIARELLSELFMILNGAHDDARVHQLNRNLRSEMGKQMKQLKDKLSFLSSLPT